MKKIIIIKEAAAITTCTVSFGYIMFQVFNWLMYVQEYVFARVCFCFDDYKTYL